MSCQAHIQQGPHKGRLCGKKTDATYCAKHLRIGILEQAKKDGIQYCDVMRGCYTVLEEHQRCCARCLHKARIHDRKREGEKRANIHACLDCSRLLTKEIRAVGKYEKELRRCIPCYATLQKLEAARTERKRNYKVEAFHNKHVAWNHYVKGAKKRGIDMTLSKTQFEQLLLHPCFYCLHHVHGEINGIDRVNNHEGYVESNVVTCCESCNMAKGTQHPQEWLDKLHAIHCYQTTHEPISPERIALWSTTYLSATPRYYTSYCKGAHTRNIVFELSEEDFEKIIQQPCYLCGLATTATHYNGIDRYDNAVGYTIENCRSCCGHCNLMKKDAPCDIILSMAERITRRYDELTAFCASLSIPHRSSKIEARTKNVSPIIADPIERSYEPINEVIVPDEVPVPVYIAEMLTKKVPEKTVKQWKVKQIYKAIQTNHEDDYKQYCETHNESVKNPMWPTIWTTFVQAIKGRTLEETTEAIQAFVVNLRRIRHNALCYKKTDPVLRTDRQQWTGPSVVRAFQEGRMEIFKQWTDSYAGDDPTHPAWIKRWETFMATLTSHTTYEECLATCQAFLTAQRTKKYRRSQTME